MPGNLRDRLKRIQSLKQDGGENTKSERTGNGVCCIDTSFFIEKGWVSAGYMTLRRDIIADKKIQLPKKLPQTVRNIISGISDSTVYEDLLFFDLETTGLSGGAGTIAFLAAFGRLVPAGNEKSETGVHALHITQYLLLDYPGENDFITALSGEFTDNTIVSYNGKCFDSQILKSRCLMSGIIPPDYSHVDLLYPARRLWKRLLPNCSQATIETTILGIDRTGDIPGAMAPEIWFAFLKNGGAGPLFGICEHNRKDIEGLASVFSAMTRVADDPIGASKKIKFDIETLAINLNNTELLRHAAGEGYQRAGLQYGLALMRAGNFQEGREWLSKAADGAAVGGTAVISVSALRAMAIDSEHRLKNANEALELTERGLGLLPSDSSWLKEFEKRRQRLFKKLYPGKPQV